MEIHIYSESFKPYLSGVTVSVDTFAKGLTQLGHDVTVFVPKYPDFQDIDLFSVFRFPSIAQPLYPGFRFALPFSRSWKSYLKIRQPDVIHTHSPYQLGFLAQRFARKNKIPFVYHFHTLYAEFLYFVPLPRWFAEPVVKALVRKFCSGCDLIITPTNIVKKMLIEQYGVTQRVEVLPTGVDEEIVKSATSLGIRDKHGISADTFLLTYCGRLSKEKNIEFLLEIFAEIVKKFHHVRFMIVGFGPHEQILKNHAQQLGLGNKVIFTGRVDREQIYNYFKVADLCIHASKVETQGLMISEAKACGKPSVAIQSLGVAEMIVDGEDGFLVADNKQMFVEKVSQLISDQAMLATFSENALRNAEANFMNSAISKKLVSFYTEIIEKYRKENNTGN